MNDRVEYKALWRVYLYHNQQARDRNTPYQVLELAGNLLLTEGITEALTLLIGGTATAFDSTHAFIGVGDNSVAPSAAQTGLQATTNKLYKAMNSGYPQVSGTSVTFQADFLEDEANFAWEEFTVANGDSDDAINLNRRAVSMGAKEYPMVRTVELVITLS